MKAHGIFRYAVGALACFLLSGCRGLPGGFEQEMISTPTAPASTQATLQPTHPTATPALPSQPLLNDKWLLIPVEMWLMDQWGYHQAREGYKILLFCFAIENATSQVQFSGLLVQIKATDSRNFEYQLRYEPQGQMPDITSYIPPGYRVLYCAWGEVPTIATGLEITVDDASKELSFPVDLSTIATVRLPADNPPLRAMGDTFEVPGYVRIKPFSAIPVERKRDDGTAFYELYVSYQLENLYGYDVTGPYFQLMDDEGNYYPVDSTFATYSGYLPVNEPVAPGLQKAGAFHATLDHLPSELQLFLEFAKPLQGPVAASQMWAIYSISQTDLESGQRTYDELANVIQNYMEAIPKALTANDVATLAALATGDELEAQMDFVSQARSDTTCCVSRPEAEAGWWGTSIRYTLLLDDNHALISTWESYVEGANPPGHECWPEGQYTGSGDNAYWLAKQGEHWLVEKVDYRYYDCY